MKVRSGCYFFSFLVAKFTPSGQFLLLFDQRVIYLFPFERAGSQETSKSTSTYYCESLLSSKKLIKKDCFVKYIAMFYYNVFVSIYVIIWPRMGWMKTKTTYLLAIPYSRNLYIFSQLLPWFWMLKAPTNLVAFV